VASSTIKKVLIIEDEKPLRDVYALILEKEGFEVSSAENGQVGIKKLHSFKPDLIILDMLMPIMDGISFLRSANLIIKHPKTKTIIVSNLSDAISKSDSKKYGVVHSFVKVDLSPADLAAVAKKYSLEI
jgi:two-component system alkaline phosphatase synthesis response regulator PhoP